MREISFAQKLEILDRANYRCEYCHEQFVSTHFELDHIISKARGGSNDKSNIAVACRRCNNNKGTHTTAVDPITGTIVPLYDPRTMLWDAHFSEFGQEIVGNSRMGRATAALLFRRTNHFIEPIQAPNDENDTPAEERDDALYRYLRYLRLQNRFYDVLELCRLRSVGLAAQGNYKRSSPLQFEIEMQRLEIAIIRAGRTDFVDGMSQIRFMLRRCTEPWMLSRLNSLRSTLLQQEATRRFLTGDLRIAQRFQYFSAKTISTSLASDLLSADTTVMIKIPVTWVKVEGHLRTAESTLNDYLKSLPDLDHLTKRKQLTYLVDHLLLLEKPVKRLMAHLEDELTSMLAISGYGHALDATAPIMMRRRWWMLQYATKQPLDIALLKQDLAYWKSLHLHNEINELLMYILRSDNSPWRINYLSAFRTIPPLT